LRKKRIKERCRSLEYDRRNARTKEESEEEGKEE